MSGAISHEDVHWNLADLLDGEGEERVGTLLDEALERAEAFAGRYRGALKTIGGDGLRALMEELAAINDLVGRAGSYAGLRFSTDTADPQRGALLQSVQERGTKLETLLLFFELEWTALDDARAEELLCSDDLDFCRHHLENLRSYRPHLLSEPEELILAEKAITARAAWTRLFDEQTSAIEVALEEPATLDVALSRLHSPSRDIRRTTAEAITLALEPGLRTRASIFNALLVDKATDDRLRSFPNWLAARNLSNEASDESVAALIAAVRARYELPRRWYRLKAKLLGLERLADYDRIAPLESDALEVPWAEARELVQEVYGGFSPTLGGIVERFFTEDWIDAPPTPGKRGGAFCSGTVPSVHPYVMLNYTSRRRDVLTLAHELGHGVHFALAARQGIFHQDTPLTLAETASVFGETLTFERLLDASPTPAARLALLGENIEDAIATVFRQVAMNGFEDLVHNERRDSGELSVARLGELWAESQGELLGDSVALTDGYHSWWSYIPHFIGSPGYVYAYAYGQLLALSVYERYLDEGPAFEERYVELLASGSSRSPEDLGAIVGVDLSDPGFWDRGLDLLERRLEGAEAAAEAADS
ncbi:MAG TPA: M3 family oligoendopeptidase [Solirubrobacteraceae bacterium]|nr:M3 family oligoendopeptidase [Solirubrobacteraceae bacterium]